MKFSCFFGLFAIVAFVATGLASVRPAAAEGAQTPTLARWIQEESPTTLTLNGIDMIGADEGWAAGEAGLILHYYDGKWHEIERATRDYLVDVDVANREDGWAVGSDAVQRFSRGAWAPYPHPSPIFPEAVATVGSSDAWILEGNRILHFTNGEWQLPEPLPGTQRMMDITMLGSSNGWAVGFGGVILKYDGHSWTQVQSPASDRLYAVSFSDAGNGWVVGGEYSKLAPSKGAVLHYANGIWNAIEVPGVPFLVDVSATPDGGAWAVSDEGVAVRLNADGSWQSAEIAKGARSLSMVSSTEGWAVGDSGLVLHYTTKALPTAPVPPPAQPSPEHVYFPQTGHFLSSGFLDYWNRHGGLEIIGYPVTEEFSELNPPPPAGDGKTYTVQYFERARFEYHPELKGTPYEVELGLLGRNVTAGRLEQPFTPVFSASNPPPADSADHRYFAPQSYFDLSYGFKAYWEQHGGLAMFGYPISQQFTEANPEDGKSYVVQYFERARFEWHPELKGTPYEIQLGLLGKQVLRDRGWTPPGRLAR